VFCRWESFWKIASGLDEPIAQFSASRVLALVLKDNLAGSCNAIFFLPEGGWRSMWPAWDPLSGGGRGGPMVPLLHDTYGSRVWWGIVPRGSRARFAAFSEKEIA
jgi:hypothetical protein